MNLAKIKLRAKAKEPTRYPFFRPYKTMAKAKGNGAKIDIMKLTHRTRDAAPRKKSLLFVSKGDGIMAKFILSLFFRF